MPFDLILKEIFKTTSPSATLRGSALYFHPWRLHILTWEKKIPPKQIYRLACALIPPCLVFTSNTQLLIPKYKIHKYKYPNTNRQIKVNKYKYTNRNT